MLTTPGLPEILKLLFVQHQEKHLLKSLFVCYLKAYKALKDLKVLTHSVAITSNIV